MGATPTVSIYFNPPIPCGMGPGLSAELKKETKISIHPSRVGWDVGHSFMVSGNTVFQSTHPVWDGTCFRYSDRKLPGYFNPPIPCGMGLRRCPCRQQQIRISIHPSRVGWDASPSIPISDWSYFNPPIPCGMGHLSAYLSNKPQDISIHPSRVGWDRRELVVEFARTNFNPPIPCGMGQRSEHHDFIRLYFNPPIPCGMGQQKIYDYIHFLR